MRKEETSKRVLIFDENQGLLQSAKALIEGTIENISVFTCAKESAVFSLVKDGNIDIVAVDEEKMTTKDWVNFMSNNPETKVINLLEFYDSIN